MTRPLRIDAHHHLWDLDRRPQPWLRGAALAPLNRTFALPELLPELDAHGIDTTIVVQSSSSLEETRDLLALARASHGRISGVVGWADLTDPDALPGVLAELAAAGPLVGIRHQVQDEADPQWLDRPDVRAGLRAVAAAGLAYDLLVTPRELSAALAAVEELPEVRFVLDHAGKPPIAAGRWEPWAEQISAVADHPNTVCKLSGLVTEAEWASWRPQDVLPHARHVLAAFGSDRVLFGSDWPVCTLAGRYADVVALAEQATADLSADERHAVFGGNAFRVYGLA
ncbi:MULTISPECIES: amidohydrolase family protein [Streptomycetaceae]|uniref:amidohydrolase family protein n=1 Tax=Streptomycetaceae TaxID=2062 RepID=UPI00300BBDA8